MRMADVPGKRTYSFAVSTFAGGIDQEPDPQCADLGKSPEAYNVRTENGALSRCGGFGRASKYNAEAGRVMQIPKLPAGGRVIVHRKPDSDILIVRGTEGEYKEKYNIMTDELEFETVALMDCMEPTFAVNYQTADGTDLIYGSPDDIMMRISEGKTWVLGGCPKFYKAAMYAERLFGVGTRAYSNRIYFSRQYDPADFTQSAEAGGYIDVMSDYGKAVDILAFENYLYIFWQYGITRLKAYGYQSEFVLSDCYRCSSEIRRETVQVCGSRILFAANDGVYAFDGQNAHKISAPITGFFENEPEEGMASGYFRDCYYLAMHSDRYEGSGNNVLLRFGLRRGKWELYTGLCVSGMFTVSAGGFEQLLFTGEGGYICTFNGADTFNGRPIRSKWVTPMSALGRPDMIKSVRCVLIGAQGSGRLRITVQSERGSASRYILPSGSRRIYRIPVRVSGQLLSLTVENEDGSDFTAAAPTVVFTCRSCR